MLPSVEKLGPEAYLPPILDSSRMAQPRLKWWQRILCIVWDADLYTKSPSERKLVFKLDCLILSTLCLSWWLKYIDQANLANAYVSGMKEDLGILANEYTYMGTAYNVALTVMTLAANLIILKVRPSLWLPMCEVGWGIFTFAQAGAKTSEQMYAFRALLGLFEASYQPVVVFYLGSWYTKTELAKRMMLWFVTGPIGLAFSGFLQAAIYKNLEGVYGIRGWRWLYIICGCMTVPVGFVLFFLLPDFPHNTRSKLFTEEEKKLAQERCARNGTVAPTGKLGMALVRQVLGHWRFWVIVPTYVLYACSIQDTNYFAIWLANNGFSVSDRNTLSSTMYVITIPFIIFYAYMSDRTGVRWAWLAGPVALACIPTGILALYDAVHTAPFNAIQGAAGQAPGRLLKEMAFMFSGIAYVTHVFYTYVNEICKGHAEERAVVVGAMNALFFSTNCWLPIVIFPQVEAPSFRKGFPATWAFGLACIPLFLLMRVMHKRQLRQLNSDEENTSGSDVDEKGERTMGSLGNAA